MARDTEPYADLSRDGDTGMPNPRVCDAKDTEQENRTIGKTDHETIVDRLSS